MWCRLNRLDEPVFTAVSKPLLTEFGIHHRLESCVLHKQLTSIYRYGHFPRVCYRSHITALCHLAEMNRLTFTYLDGYLDVELLGD